MGVMDKWVAEFFIRRKKNPRVSPTNLLSALKFRDSADDCSNNLKKASVLRDISDSLIRGNVSEGTLDLLETLEKLHQGSSVLTESHKSAYCWTAAECTVRLMWPLSASEGLYGDAVERIWTKRIGVLKERGSGLVSEELLKWEADLRKAVEDDEVYKRIRESNVRYSAVCFLNQLLEEQWAVLGSCSLESFAQRMLLKRRKGADKGSREDPNAVDGDNRDVDGVECLENDEQHAAEGERTMGAQEQEHEPSLDKGDKMVAQELKYYLLEIQRQLQEPNNANITPPQPSRVNSTRKSGQQQDSASESRVRPHLPTPEPLNVSPLKKKRANPAARRIKKFWTPEEEAVLREGVKEYGKSWKEIKNANPEVFAERTEVDLKDKWRNLVR
ncbi:hypothetical protein HID58_068931 [Brassica napus]|uniref:BnaC05g46800D protein n=2 Tax=Brassica napus TaxID=3708 RepID=A0A078HX20_BRANA|nr:uncharacterized protein BNAC05G46800D isoform X1 [Brassica napus]KAH0881537.1 hypothetical protein HID58_068931 [Brassica napus]CAF1939175.1 unnamed protein product [Brassica napus]CDY41924.1 BnaC05g46800D [Brassica napus]